MRMSSTGTSVAPWPTTHLHVKSKELAPEWNYVGAESSPEGYGGVMGYMQ